MRIPAAAPPTSTHLLCVRAHLGVQVRDPAPVRASIAGRRAAGAGARNARHGGTRPPGHLRAGRAPLGLKGECRAGRGGIGPGGGTEVAALAREGARPAPALATAGPAKACPLPHLPCSADYPGPGCEGAAAAAGGILGCGAAAAAAAGGPAAARRQPAGRLPDHLIWGERAQASGHGRASACGSASLWRRQAAGPPTAPLPPCMLRALSTLPCLCHACACKGLMRSQRSQLCAPCTGGAAHGRPRCREPVAVCGGVWRRLLSPRQQAMRHDAAAQQRARPEARTMPGQGKPPLERCCPARSRLQAPLLLPRPLDAAPCIHAPGTLHAIVHPAETLLRARREAARRHHGDCAAGGAPAPRGLVAGGLRAAVPLGRHARAQGAAQPPTVSSTARAPAPPIALPQQPHDSLLKSATSDLLVQVAALQVRRGGPQHPRAPQH